MIAKKDIEEYLNEHSDFGFEVLVLQKLSALGLRCQHGGTYADPVTKKQRQFDLRAVVAKEHSKVRLAIECKNLTSAHPLIVHRMPRSNSEAFQEYVTVVDRPRGFTEAFLSRAKTNKFVSGDCAYRTNDWVGKSTDQIFRHEHTEKLKTGDGKVFEKISQALNSTRDLFDLAINDSVGTNTAIWPVLVVPSDTLWAIDYNYDGTLANEPAVVQHASLFVDLEWTDSMGLSYRISHLDIITVDEIERFFRDEVDSQTGVLRFG